MAFSEDPRYCISKNSCQILDKNLVRHGVAAKYNSPKNTVIKGNVYSFDCANISIKSVL